MSDLLVAEIEHLMVTDELLKTIYCLKEGTDTAHGLDSCDNYKQWLKDIIKQYETMRGY